MRRVALLAVTGLALAALPAGAAAPEPYQREGRTELASATHAGEPVNASYGRLSADGRYLLFSSGVRAMVPEKTTTSADVFLRDRVTGSVERVSLTSAGEELEASASDAVMSADMRYVTFTSRARNIDPAKTTLFDDVFLRDRTEGTTERVSLATSGAQAQGNSLFPSVSDDGRHVAFLSDATNLDETSDGSYAVYVRDRETSTTIQVSEPGRLANWPSISADGSTVVFEVEDPQLTPLGPLSHVYAYDMASGTTTLVSRNSVGHAANGSSSWPSVSADGRLVAFTSNASNLVPHDTNHALDVFVHDLQTASTERVSLAGVGGELERGSREPAISPNGRYVAFVSNAVALGEDGSVNTVEAFVHDRWTRTTERVSLSADGQPVSSRAWTPQPSDDGTVLFSSPRTMVAAVPSSFRKLYTRDRGPDVGPAWLEATAAGDEVQVGGAAMLPAPLLAQASNDAVGADMALSSAEVRYRPERADLLVRWRTPGMPAARSSVRTWWSPAVPSAAVGAGLLHGLDLEVDGERYEVRVAQAGLDDGAALPHAALYRCEVTCEQAVTLAAAWGTAGEEVAASVPLAALGTGEGAQLAGIQAWVGTGTVTSGGAPATTLDLGDATLPVRSATLGVAPASASADDVAFDYSAQLDGGRLAGSVPAADVPGSHTVWARVCLGEDCGVAPLP